MRVCREVAKKNTAGFACDVCEKDMPICHEICTDSLPLSLYAELLLLPNLDTTMWVINIPRLQKTCCITGEKFNGSYLIDMCGHCVEKHYHFLTDANDEVNSA